jgi:hypothetical protein
MEWTIPGTVLTAKREDAPNIEKDFKAMFLGGGIMLSQVAAISGLEPYDVQNWVKRRLLPPPNGKRYDLNQLCRIININMLKKVLHMEQITGLLTYINGDLDDHSDDLIDDSKLYFMFVELAAKCAPCMAPTAGMPPITRPWRTTASPFPAQGIGCSRFSGLC